MQWTEINGEYHLFLPEHRAAREQWKTGWEVERINEMLDTIKPTDIVFDLGVEEGDITALIAAYTKAKMVLFEPNDRVIPCIREIWRANLLPPPLDFFRGFVSSKTTEGYHHQVDPSLKSDLPMIPDHGFKQLYENYPDVPQITLDQYCEETGIYPDVITMDVEGSEFEVIKGAESLLKTKRPIIFMSVHPEFLYESYRNEGVWKDRLGERCHVVHMLGTFKEWGYGWRVIEWDLHECHFKFYPI